MAKRGVRSSVQTTIDNAIPRWDGTTGRVLQTTPHTIDDNSTVLLDQNNNFAALNIDSEATTANVIDILAPTTTSGNIVDIGDADSLTTGKILNLVSNSADVGTRTLVQITNDNTAATGTTVLRIQQDSANVGINLAQTGNGIAFNIDSSATTVNALRFAITSQTSAAIINIPNANSLTTGQILNLVSNSADVSGRSLVQITNDNTLATGTTCLSVKQDAAQQAVYIDQNANFYALNIDSDATSVNALRVNISLQTTAAIFTIPSANSLTTGAIMNLVSASASASTRNLVFIRNQTAAAVGATPLTIQQDAAGQAMLIDQNANGVSLTIDSEATTVPVLNITNPVTTTSSIITVFSADALTTGNILNLTSNSVDVGTRSLVNIVNDNTAATGATCLNIIQDAAQNALNISQNADGRSILSNSAATSSDMLTLQNTGSPRFQVAWHGGTTVTQGVVTAGSPNALAVTGGAHTTLTASVEAIDARFNFARTVQFATGALALQRVFSIEAPTYGFVAASTLTNAITTYITGGPIAGTNATIDVTMGLMVDNVNTTFATDMASAFFTIPNIQDGKGANSHVIGLLIGDNGADVSLGNQTATTTNVFSLYLDQQTYTSTTLTRTVTNPVTLYIQGAPVAGANVVFSNGPYALHVDDGMSRFDGRIIGAQGADVASANDLTLGNDGNAFEITGATQINAITTKSWQNGSQITMLFTANPTVKHNTAGGAGTAVMLLAGSADFAATAGDTLTLLLSEIGGSQAWRELARTAI